MFELSLDVDGLDVVQDRLEILARLGNAIQGVELNARMRQKTPDRRMNADVTNAQVLMHLKATGRDFFTPSQADAEEMAREWVNWFEHEFPNFPKGKLVTVTKKRTITRTPEQLLKKNAIDLATQCFRKMMLKFMEQCHDRILNQETNVPPFNHTLSKEWAEFKMESVGFTHPIGKFTGQLTDNLNPNGPAARNIRPIRGKS